MITKDKYIIGIYLLAISFLIVGIVSVLYIMNYTNFYDQQISLLYDKEQLFGYGFVMFWVLGIIIFISSLLFLKDWRTVIILFIFDILKIVLLVLLIIGIFVPYLKLEFKLVLLLSSFIIYYAIYEGKKIYNEIAFTQNLSKTLKTQKPQ